MEIHSRLLRSYFGRSGQLTRARAMMGTRLKERTLSCSIRRKTSLGTKREIMT